uniref:Uncharacterized protein n=1 Tax=Setaria digitata TaxID=48799 RepID=A0A915PQ87_9BILA
MVKRIDIFVRQKKENWWRLITEAMLRGNFCSALLLTFCNCGNFKFQEILVTEWLDDNDHDNDDNKLCHNRMRKEGEVKSGSKADDDKMTGVEQNQLERIAKADRTGQQQLCACRPAQAKRTDGRMDGYVVKTEHRIRVYKCGTDTEGTPKGQG